MKHFLFEINHPCHAHLFKNLIHRLRNVGHRVDILAKPREVITHILDYEGIPYRTLAPPGQGFFGKAIRQVALTRQVMRMHQAQPYNLGIGVSVTLPLSGLPSLVLDDDDRKATPMFAFLAHRRASLLLRPACLQFEGAFRNTLYLPTLHEWAYLHPTLFSPDPNILQEQGLKPGEPFAIIRLSALNAHHDLGRRGISKTGLDHIIQSLEKKGKVIVLAENGQKVSGTEPLRINPARIHHLMALARIVVSDGQTMCSEAACLGVPSVRINDFVGRITYLDELEQRWKLSFGFKPGEVTQAVKKMESILAEDSDLYKIRRKQLLAQSLDLTTFLEWLVTDFEENSRSIRQNGHLPDPFRPPFGDE